MRQRISIVLFVTSLGLLTQAGECRGQTRPASGDRRIALISDTHVSLDRQYSDYLDNFQTVIAEVNAANVDAVLLSGDLTQSFSPAAATKFQEMATQLHAPFWCVAGNHDVGNKQLDGKPATVTDARMAAFEHAIGPAFFTAEILPGVRVLGITSSLFDSGTTREADQWKFLETQLQSPHAGLTLLLTHYPPFVVTKDEADIYFNINSVCRPRLLHLLKQGAVAAILSGHLHRPISFEWDGIPVIGAPATSFGLPEGKQDVGWKLVTIHADNTLTSDIHYIVTRASMRPSVPAGTELLHAQPTTRTSGVSDRVHIFYYGWYGAPPLQDHYIHWQQGGHLPPDDIGSNFYPLLGAYSSADPKILKQHMAWLSQARVGVITLSWWGRGSYEDEQAAAIFDAAAAAGIQVNFHIEPYSGRTPDRVADDIAYLLQRFGRNPAFYRARDFGNKPVFYVFDCLKDSADAWHPAIAKLRGVVEPVLLLGQTSDLRFIEEADFDGGYPYDVLTPFKDARFLAHWAKLTTDFRAAGKLFIPSVGPGYDDTRAVPDSSAKPPAEAKTRNDGLNTGYDTAWQAAIECDPAWVTVTSFNEWHEGSQIEPAVAKQISGYAYPAYNRGSDQYLARTAYWIGRLTESGLTLQQTHPIVPAQQ